MAWGKNESRRQEDNKFKSVSLPDKANHQYFAE